MSSAGQVKKGGRPKGSVNRSTAETRDTHAKCVAAYARRAWLRDDKTTRGPAPSKDDLHAAIAHLDRRALLSIDGAMLMKDYKTAAELIEDLRTRIEGRPKYQHEMGGIEDGVPIPVSATGSVVYRCVVPRRAPRQGSDRDEPAAP
jgi:hypothetical protein